METKADLDKIRQLATEFRLAIEACTEVRKLIYTLKDFPSGSCGDATLLLAKYLEENGCGKFSYYLGGRSKHSHAWLQRGNLIVDITADQFEDQTQSVIVTVDQGWHSHFDGKEEHVADMDIYDLHTKSMLRAGYSSVLKILQSLKTSGGFVA